VEKTSFILIYDTLGLREAHATWRRSENVVSTIQKCTLDIALEAFLFSAAASCPLPHLQESWPDVEYQDGSVKINFVALLSARGMFMLTDKPVEDLTVKEAKEKMTDVDNAKEKNSAEEKEGQVENLPVADVIMTKQDDDENKAESKENKVEIEEKMTVT
jgi:hypothetical protein